MNVTHTQEVLYGAIVIRLLYLRAITFKVYGIIICFNCLKLLKILDFKY